MATSVPITWSHPGRVRAEAVLVPLAGTGFVPASSGNTVRHRLNRGGDCRLSRALTIVAIVRLRVDPATRAYVTRRRAEDRITKEIMRWVTRSITREMFRTLVPAHPTSTT